jgi:hypothetical protein
MDPQRFDRLAKSLSVPGTRRFALSAALAAVLTLIGLPGTEAGRKTSRRHDQTSRNVTAEACRKRGQSCGRDRHCCSDYCRQPDKSKPGRCDCLKLNASCREDRNCCPRGSSPVKCRRGTCQVLRPQLRCRQTCAGCCDSAGRCLPGTATPACGRAGAPCTSCSGTGVSCGGGGTPGVCSCTADCLGKACGAGDGCGGTCQSGTCPGDLVCTAGTCTCADCANGCCSGSTCEAGNTTVACGEQGVACVTCSGAMGVSCRNTDGVNGTCVRDCTGGCGGGSCQCVDLEGGGPVCATAAGVTCFASAAACAAGCPSGRVCLDGPSGSDLCNADANQRACAVACAAT